MHCVVVHTLPPKLFQLMAIDLDVLYSVKDKDGK